MSKVQNRTFHVRAEANEISARLPDFLTTLLPEARCGTHARANCEIVLAEVLNNIAEHSFSGREPGAIEIRSEIAPSEIQFRIIDLGREMPGFELPKTELPRSDVAVTDLPEGGFGWYMIHKLARDINYIRENDKNILRFSIPLS